MIPMIEKYGRSPRARVVSTTRDGLYLDADGLPIRVDAAGIPPGAAILWRFGPGGRKGHAAVLVEDSGPGGKADGLLGQDDLSLHAMWDEPRVEAISGVLPDLDPAMALPPVGDP